MTRKMYLRKLQVLVIAIHNHPTTPFGYSKRSLGDALREVRDKVNAGALKNTPWRSYDEAWNCEAMRWARDFYGVR